ncbi:MAG: hypothetical protein ACJAQX_001403 [Polaribacter sp.]
MILGDKITLQLIRNTSKFEQEIPKELEAVSKSDYNTYQIFLSVQMLTKTKVLLVI